MARIKLNKKQVKAPRAVKLAATSKSTTVRKGAAVVNLRISQAELARIFGLQSSELIRAAQPGGPLRGLQGEDELFCLGDAVAAYARHLREKAVASRHDAGDVKTQVELEKMYYVRQKRMGDRLRVKLAIAMSMSKAMLGVVSRIKDRIRKLPIEQQEALLSIYDQVDRDLGLLDKQRIAKDAEDALPNSDIEEELDEEMRDNFGEEDDDGKAG